MQKRSIERIHHTSGLTVLFEPFERRSTLSLNCWIRAGSLHEGLHETGMAHFMEHMLFTGSFSKGNTEMMRAMEQVGGYSNAYTTFDHTMFECVVPLNQYQKAFETMREILLEPVFDLQQIEKEKKIILEEYFESQDQDEVVFEENFWKEVYEGKSISRPILGLPEDIQSFTQGSLVDFYQTNYVPENMVLSVCGNLSRAQINSAIDFFTKNVPPKNKQEKLAIDKGIFNPVVFEYKKSKHQRKVQLLFEIPSYHSKDSPALEVLNEFIGGGEQSLLFQALFKDQKIVSDVGSHLVQTCASSHMQIEATPLEGYEDRVLAVMKDILSDGLLPQLNQEMLGWIQQDLIAEILYSLETTSGRSKMNGYFEALRDDFQVQFNHIHAIESVTLDQILEVQNRWLKNPAIGMWKPEL